MSVCNNCIHYKVCSVEDNDHLTFCADMIPKNILDKIGAEIEHEYNHLSATMADETLELGERLGLKMSLKIIDKYRKEMDEKL